MANPVDKIQQNSDSDGPIISDNVIRIQLRKPVHRKWQLQTGNQSPGSVFPTIQLFDCDGNILVETNDDNISVRSSNFRESQLKSSQSLNEKDYRNILHSNELRKSNTVVGTKIYTRLFVPQSLENNSTFRNLKVTNFPREERICIVMPSRHNSEESALPSSNVFSDWECSSFKSSDNDSSAPEIRHSFVTSRAELLLSTDTYVNVSFRRHRIEEEKSTPPGDHTNISSEKRLRRQQQFDENDNNKTELHKSKSLPDMRHHHYSKVVRRSKTQVIPPSSVVFAPPAKKVSFLNTYLKSLPNRVRTAPEWIISTIEEGYKRESARYGGFAKPVNYLGASSELSDDRVDSDNPNASSDVAAAEELGRRWRMYQQVPLHTDDRSVSARTRIQSEGDCVQSESSSSESLDEADAVLNRLRRRILKNKCREKRTRTGNNEYRTTKRARGPLIHADQSSDVSSHADDPALPDALVEECLRRCEVMGSNISQHSVKGLTGRRARSSGDLCNGESKSPTESAVYGSVVGEVMGWNRSLPNHLDGNRHLASEYNGTLPRGNNNYGESYKCHPKGVRAWRYRASKATLGPEPVWKLQDGCDQGYGSERSPEEDYVQQRLTTYEEYEEQLRLMYPFITEENTFTVVVEKDGRGLGMSVSGGEEGGGLVRIRRLYPPQPAWRTGLLAPRDLLLAANGIPLTGLSTYEALDVLRTTAQRVELRVCRPPADILDCLTPPAPPTPPTRHTPAPPPDPLNCHPMHTRLSATTSTATTSSSEGRYGTSSAIGMRRDEVSSPVDQGGYDRPDSLKLPNLEPALPVYDVQYGEFDIIMTKVNGSLGFTLRKEDHSALGHYVRALVREPALSDGRIQPGDRIVAVNEVSMSGMSHTDAVSFLRSCGADVRLRLYRDHAATPLSPLSPHEPHEPHERQSPSDSDQATVRPKPHLRQEAVNMLCDLAARRLTPDAADGSRSPCLSPRKYRRLTRDSTDHSHGSVAPHGYELNNLDNDVLDAPNVYQDTRHASLYPSHYQLSAEPISMPFELSNDSHFAHKSPAYQSALVHPTNDATAGEGYKDDGNGLKKWKATTLSPDKERKLKPEHKPKTFETQKENLKPREDGGNKEPTILTVELNRGWNSRLGFSIQSHPDSGQSYVSAIYSDSVAARDGRLRKGDVILQVNDENVTSMKTPEVIDLMRILRGSICITVLRPSTL